MKNNLGLLNANILKIIALVTMTIDHIGVILFPSVSILRIIGRIAFPIFAFFIAEGCLHTKNKLRYFLLIFGLGLIFEIVTKCFILGKPANILITFSLSIILCYVVILFKKSIKIGKIKNTILLSILLFFVLCVVVTITDVIPRYTGSYYVGVDYGIFGVLVPVLVVIFDNHYAKTVMLTIALCVMSFFLAWKYQWYCLLSIPLIVMYNGERGKYRLKYLFYVYYPSHIIVLYFISFLPIFK